MRSEKTKPPKRLWCCPGVLDWPEVRFNSEDFEDRSEWSPAMLPTRKLFDEICRSCDRKGWMCDGPVRCDLTRQG